MQPESSGKRSDDGNTNKTNGPCGDSAAYMYGGLSEDGRAAFEAHLNHCVGCSQFVTDVSLAVGKLPLPGLAAASQESAGVGAVMLVQALRSENASRRGRSPLWLFGAIVASLLTVAFVTEIIASRISNAKESRNLLAGEAAAMRQPMTGDGGTDSEYYIDKVVKLRSPSAGIEARGEAAIIVDASGAHFIVQAEKLPKPGKNEAYHVWLLRDGIPVCAGTFQINGGSGRLRYEVTTDQYERIAISLEPTAIGNSPRGRIVLTGRLF